MNYKKLKDLIRKELKEQGPDGGRPYGPPRNTKKRLAPNKVKRYRIDAGGCLACPSYATPAQCPYTDPMCSPNVATQSMGENSLKNEIKKELYNLINEKSPCQTGCYCRNGGGCSDACCDEYSQPTGHRGTPNPIGGCPCPGGGISLDCCEDARTPRRGTGNPMKGCPCGDGTSKPECCDRLVNRPLEEMMSSMGSAGTREWEEALSSSSPIKLCCLLRAACCSPR